MVPETVVSARGVAYADPTLDTLLRHPDGIPWAACGGTPTGSPAYAQELHPKRQRAAMEGPQCAGCGYEPARDERGTLWLLPLLDDAADTVWEGVHTVTPPMCEICKTKATRFCPRLREGHVELRVQEAEKVGVRGTLYPRPGMPGEPDPDALVLFDTPDEAFVIARGLVRELRGVTVVAFSAPTT
ncbi:hypothetical protein ABTY59_32285 [Streptomyces sp. NPDC096079]|uniref:hypothetical protein n=1 Tax=Streptomyces sp. NPDC096079 TaxID=3155820 RepID=UPI003325BCDC